MPRKIMDEDCPEHPGNRKRSTCKACNAAYMRRYQREHRLRDPVWALLDRAQARARRRALPFDLTPSDLTLPAVCPALGIPLKVGSVREEGSPSLDRIDPTRGYVTDNVRIISDHANRLKSNRGLADLQRLADGGDEQRRPDYRRVMRYLERENTLAAVRRRAQQGGREGEEWAKVGRFLERVCDGRPGRIR